MRRKMKINGRTLQEMRRNEATRRKMKINGRTWKEMTSNEPGKLTEMNRNEGNEEE